MAERIDFYILENAELISFTCRLLEKAYKESYRAFVYAQSAEEAKKLDDSLWTFRDISFVPHRQSNDDRPATPIVIGHADINTEPADLLVITADNFPQNYQDYQRVAIIVPNDDNRKQQARQLYKKLKSSNQTLQIHTIQ